MSHVLHRVRAARGLLAALAAGVLAIGFAAAPAHAAGAGLSGVVTEHGKGTPLAGVDVQALKIIDIGGGARSASIEAEGSTDDAGAYSFPDLAPGSYVVGLAKDAFVGEYSGGVGDFWKASEITVPATFDAALTRAAVLQGALFDEQGEPVTAGSVTVSATFENPLADGRAHGDLGPDGYRIAGLVPGKYTVEFDVEGRNRQFAQGTLLQSQAEKFTLKAGINVVNDTLVPRPTGVLTGTVTDKSTGAPIPGACVNITGVEVYPAQDSTYCAGTDGRYELHGLPTQSVSIEAYDRKTNHADSAYTKVWVSDGAATTQDFALAPAGSLAGFVVDGATGLPAPRAVCVDALRVSDGAGSGDCADNPQGKYKMDHLPGGMYRLKLSQIGDPQYGLGWVKADGTTTTDETQAATFQVRPGHTKHPTPIKLAKAATISGVVTDKATGKPIEGVCVGSTHWSEGAGQFNWTGECTDTQGRYTVRNLGPGSWVTYVSTPEPYGRVFSGNVATRSQAKVYEVSGGERFTENFALVPGAGTLTGSVKRTKGSTYEVEIVSAEDRNDHPVGFAWGHLTHGQSNYTITGITPQKVKVALLGPNGKQQWYGGSTFEEATVLDIGPGPTTLDLSGT